MARKKTKKMLIVEAKFAKPAGKTLEELLAELVTENGLSGTADYLGVSKATLGYWLLKLDIIVKRVALLPGQRIRISTPQADLPEKT